MYMCHIYIYIYIYCTSMLYDKIAMVIHNMH